MRQVAVSTVLFDGYSDAITFDAIAAAGATRVEPAFIAGYGDFDEATFIQPRASEMRRRAEGTGLTIQAVSAHIDPGADDAVAKLSRRIAFAAELGARFLITNAGTLKDRTRVLANLAQAVPRLEAAGIVLALENPGHGDDALVSNAMAGAALTEAIDTQYVRLNYDACNMWTYSGLAVQPAADLAHASANGRAMISHIHLKDVAERSGIWSFCTIGDGEIDWPALWRVLPPDVPLSLELPLRLSRPAMAAPVRANEAVAFEVLEQALAASLRYVEGLENTVRPGGASG